MENIITFRNENQKVLFESELAGQISDGMWENAKPSNHWESWCNAKVVVGEEVGVNFRTIKNNYNFLSKMLLEIVGDRMLRLLNVKNSLPNISDKNIDTLGGILLQDLENYAKVEKDKSCYWKDTLTEIFKECTREEIIEAQASRMITMKDLQRELRDMKKIIKIRN